MPPRKESSMAGSADHISSLPDTLLHHVMSFLQAQEAVGLCVLAQRWRHLWKSMRVLHVTGGRPVQMTHRFLDHVIALRGHHPLDECLFHFDTFSGGDWQYVNLWIQYALACQVRALDVSFRNGRSFPLPDLPLVSQTLTQLKLHYLRLNARFLDFSSCPALEDLNMTRCSIPADKISSRSLKHLSILECYFTRDTRTRISAPSLVSLQLIAVDGRTPLIEDMPVLVTASVRFDDKCKDSHGYLSPVACGDPSCECCNGTDRGICDDFSCEMLSR
uniref:Uncharacterized protein n=1 Tax=Avena sativa TaxID=4498 RepID=A0ACD6A4E0_AVESA